MSKRSVKLILMVLAVAVLIGAYFIVSKLGNEGGDDSSTTTASPAYTVAKVDLNTIYQFGFTYDGTRYTFRLNEAGDTWVWDDDSSLPISNVKVALMLMHFSEMTSTVLIDGVTDEKLDEYGLKDPSIEVYFKDANGIHSYELGIVNPYNSLVYITSSAEKSMVYMVSKDVVEEYSCSIDDMLQVEENKTFSANEAITLTITSQNDTLIYNYYPNGNSASLSSNCKWYLSLNGEAELPINEVLGEELSAALKSNIFAEYITYDEEKYSEYGLAEKNVKVNISGINVVENTDSSTGEVVKTKTPVTFEFYLGDSDKDGFSYAITDNSPLLYITSASVYDLIYSFDRNNLASIMSGYIWNINPSDINEITFGYNGNDYALVISESASAFKCTLNGNEISYESVKSLIENVASLAWDTDISKADAKNETNETALSIKVVSGENSDVITLNKYSDEYYRINYNGRSEFLMLKSNFDKLVSDFTNIINAK